MLRCSSALICVLLLVAVAAADCPIDNRSSHDQLLSFLRASKELPAGQQDRECISFALKRLQNVATDNPDETIAVVISYLDFERPLSEAERHGFGGNSLTLGRYPAIGTCFLLAKLRCLRCSQQ